MKKLLVIPIAAVMMQNGFCATKAKQLNVLFIAVDDLRPALGAYGFKQAISPNIDKLASEGRMFLNHYVQVPISGASRSSMLTGRMPYVKEQIDNEALEVLPRELTKDALTMPELFKRNGYKTVCIGKISHSSNGWTGYGQEPVSDNFHIPNAWSEILTPQGNWKNSLVVAYPDGRDRDADPNNMPYCVFKEMQDNDMPDGMFADAAIQRLKEFSKSGEPFFFGLGFVKPHLPFVAPQKYKDLYNGVSIPSLYGMQRGDTKKASKSPEFYKYTTNRPFETPNDNECLTEEDAQEIRRSYLACVSYTDAQIGKVLEVLEETGLAENTIVVLWGDHGWHLGENNVWGKHTPLEKSLNSPLIIRSPGLKKGGQSTEALASSVDIYPTLIELCRLKNQKTYQAIEGKSLVPVLKNPKAEVSPIAVSFWKTGTSFTDGKYRLIVSSKKGSNTEYVYELYNHQSDPGELKNIATQFPDQIDRMMLQLKKVYPAILVH